MNRIILAVASVLAAASPAVSQGLCAPASAMSDYLRSKYGETVVLTGTGQTGAPILMTANPETGTWTMLMISPEAVCVMMTGRDFDAISVPVGKPT